MRVARTLDSKPCCGEANAPARLGDRLGLVVQTEDEDEQSGRISRRKAKHRANGADRIAEAMCQLRN
jgi:hypothetical protein